MKLESSSGASDVGLRASKTAVTSASTSSKMLKPSFVFTGVSSASAFVGVNSAAGMVEVSSLSSAASVASVFCDFELLTV